MRHTLAILGLSAAVAAAALPGSAAELQTLGGPGKVTVHHGSTVEVVPARSSAGKVMVQRGTVSRQPQPSELDRLRGTLEKASRLEVAGSDDTVWIVDRETQRLTACRILETTVVGRNVVRCLKRKLRLPR